MMERLTFEGNFCDIAQCRENPCPYNGSCSQREVWEKLKDYEDTGMEPEEIKPKRGLPPVVGAALDAKADHMRDLLKAEREGRLVVLPCKVGDDVYFLFEEHLHKVRVQGIACGRNNECILNFGGYPVQYAWGSEVGKTVFLTRAEAEAALC